ncbi:MULTISPECIES: MerR family transcriptional regulator [unclassified Paenibacillus]|uniref:MerR family transcriptional regulator n=1 Tax=unclassified Paenibacillus TaxID=185978 RepID=UPI0024063F91|nr:MULTISPECIES: MerR family transcriptional regulator [unclassified Paenibacillus]MDF9845352.1 DNA-binding transcriptional MerR regulator [Paenibacillus sp. PastF-2]MDF9851927.1 DNA-binding transcriptional MerR regulator [Paenibacillus sp. PastM-2]MDF9858491.1 DNA-binding transcriptional MerR regulator [Paenibacillus sp. PastF-1]MDH6483764.1 DNA-binding transcriptional MerR regulator [Paenibacillus sp. PastH-2]MDH6511146.1 DNA-binding transcriptional MerR regulator [Paenibacillus sp. PastM-3]
MEYTVQKLGALAGISPRTLRYYDEFGLLKPARINSSGYRIYGQAEVNLLQQILFYRELGLTLEAIRDIVTSPSFDGTRALREHHEQLLQRRKQLDELIANVEQTLAQSEGRITMSNEEKFAGFKQKLIENNEQKYGQEIREKYGGEAVEKSNSKLRNMTEEQYAECQKLEEDIFAALEQAMEEGDSASELAQKAAGLHRQWLGFSWDSYTKEAHAGLAQMYVDDERFTAYYDKRRPGMAAFLRDAVHVYTGAKQ